VVNRLSVIASSRVNAMLIVRAPILSQANNLLNRVSWAGGKKEANKSRPAETKSLGRMGEQFTIATHVIGYVSLLFSSNWR
jgi:hypothetical protein